MKDEGLCVGFSKLGQDQVVIFDEDEDAVTITIPDDVFSPVPDDTIVPNLVCPWGTQRVGVAEFGDTFPFGWMYLNLNVNGNMTLQSHVSVIHTASGLFSVGYQAIGLDNANDTPERVSVPWLARGPRRRAWFRKTDRSSSDFCVSGFSYGAGFCPPRFFVGIRNRDRNGAYVRFVR